MTNKQRFIFSVVLFIFISIGLVGYQRGFFPVQDWIFNAKVYVEKETKHPLIIPKINGVIPDGKLIRSHFKGDKGPFVIVAADKVKIHTSPSLQSPHTGYLRESQRVRVLFISPKNEATDLHDGSWVFIAHESGEPLLGWIPDHNLGYVQDFRPLNEWKHGVFNLKKGHYTATFYHKQDGSHKVKWKSRGQGLFLEGEYFVRMHSFRKIFWAKKESPDDWPHFFVNEDKGFLKNESRYRHAFQDNIEKGEAKKERRYFQLKFFN